MSDRSSKPISGPSAATASDLSEQTAVRSDKRLRILRRGEQAYPVGVKRTHAFKDIRARHGHLQAGEETGETVGAAGRVVFLRNTGKLCFATLQEGDGTRLQTMISLAHTGEEGLKRWKELVDLGDHLFVHGQIISSKRGELSIMADRWEFAAKALRPLPTLHNELSEENRVRQRYVDLIVRDDARDIVMKRARALTSLRSTLSGDDFVEVETPMLQTLHGGAAARPFKTHMNAYDINLFLRIAPELFLKRAVVGGIDKVFEINRNFRNEGADSTHSPEFAMLEAYQAYGDYNTMADLTQKLVQNAAEAVAGSPAVTLPDGTTYDLGGPWSSITMYGSLSEATGRDITPETKVSDLEGLAAENNVDITKTPRYHGKLVEELWEHLVGDSLYAPTFVRDFPVETSPLVRDHREIAGIVEKWDLYIRGFELATGYSELTDPVIQRERLVRQAAAAAAGDEEAMAVDEDFLCAMEYGMPPTGGMGMGIDRLLMALTGLGIRETILFPLVKP